MKGLFVTGTGTGVGKTVVTRAITRCLVNSGRRVMAVKPVESGVPRKDGMPAPVDVRALMAACKSRAPMDAHCAYLLTAPVSPHLAAGQDGVVIEEQPILDLLHRARQNADIVIAEGAGGLLVPLSDQLLYADVIARTGFALLIVAPDALGSINGTLLTIEAARARAIPVAGVVLNRGPAAELGNRHAIETIGKVPVLGVLPHCPLDDEELAQAAANHLDLRQMLED